MMKETHDRQQQTTEDHRDRVTRVRNRIPRSCLACRTRKLKCNREKPCQNCIVRGTEASSSCTYVGAANPKPSALSGTRPSNGIDVKGRLDRLESLVRTMISGTSASESITKSISTSSGLAAASVYVEVGVHPVDSLSWRAESDEGTKGRSTDEKKGDVASASTETKVAADSRSTHWEVILNDICAIKDAWSEKDDFDVGVDGAPDRFEHGFRPSFLTGLSPPPDREMLLSSLPSRDAADKLLDRFFETYNPAVPAKTALHVPTFYKQYQRHWDDPSKTSMIWIGLLFGVLTIAMHSYRSPGEEPAEYEGMSTTLFNLYRIRTAQCLEATNITRPTEFMIETLLLYSLAEYVEQRDGEIGVWILSGLMMRLAIRQGYHRDPSTLPSITPFQAEMRRRLWILISNHELLFSVQVGAPRIVHRCETDVLPPLNIHESELDASMTELPQERPATEPTEISYQLAKNRVMVAYGLVIEHLHSLSQQPYTVVMQLDANLLAARAAVPAHLSWGPMSSMIGFLESQIMERAIIQLFWAKAICVLHRKFLTSPSPEYVYSRKVCVSSALLLLEQQSALHSESHPNGLMPRIRWWKFSLHNHDYLLAAMIVCLALYSGKRHAESTSTSLNSKGGSTYGEEKFQETASMLTALMRARDIWTEVSPMCGDAKKAIAILTVVMEKLGMGTRPSADITIPSDFIGGNGSGRGLSSEAGIVSTKKAGGILTPASRAPDQSTGTPLSWDLNSGLRYSGPVDMEANMAPPYMPMITTPLTAIYQQPSETNYASQDTNLISDNLFSSNGIFNNWEPDQDLDLPENLDWFAWDFYINHTNPLHPNAPIPTATSGVPHTQAFDSPISAATHGADLNSAT